MRLSTFIDENREPILKEWEAFAMTCTPACAGMDNAALRDHADAMLRTISADLKTTQADHEQQDKSKGLLDTDETSPPTAAEDHGSDRAESGFTVEQMISEYRALRASVLRLWSESKGTFEPTDVEDITRFNEAIDQALAESIQRYTEDLSESKEMFLAMLGHDLRTPLGAITTAAKFMVETQELPEPHRTLTGRIASSSTRMALMVGDLLDFTRSRLGGGIPIVRASMCMDEIVHDVVDEVISAFPGSKIDVDARGNQHGNWDAQRISQALSNLISNAVEHGQQTTPVHVVVGGDEREITVAVHNRGSTIPAEDVAGIFNPMKVRQRRPTRVSTGPSSSLGLGLYIAERIATAHNGRITLESSDQTGTIFTLHLPRD